MTTPLSDADLFGAGANQPQPMSDDQLFGAGTQPEQPIRARDLFVRQMIGQGALAGFGDEGEAALRATYDKLKGGDTPWEDSYNAHLANARTMNKRFEEAHPVESNLAQAAGATAGLLVPGPDVVDAATWGGRAANAAIHGAAYGGLYGFGSGEGGVAKRAESGAAGAAAGGAVGGVLSPLAEGVVQVGGRVIAPAVRSVVNPGEEAANRLGLAAAQDAALPPNVTQPQRGLNDQQINAATAAGFNPTNIDRLGEQGRSLADAAATQSPVARATLNQTLQDQHLAQFPQVNNILDDMVQGQGSLDTRTQLRQAAQAENQRAYGAAYAHPNASDPVLMGSSELMNMLPAPVMQDALRKTLSTSANEAVLNGHIPIKNPFSVDETGRTIIKDPNVSPNLAFWDQMQKNLRDIIEGGTDMTGKMTNEARQTSQLRGRMLDLLDSAVPEYQAARRGAAHQFGMEDMLDVGKGIVNNKLSNDEALRLRMSATPSERELAKIGIVDALKKKFGDAKDAADLSKLILQSPNERTKVGMFLGPDNMQRLIGARNFLTMQGLARNAVQGNSKTAQRAIQTGLMGAGGGIGGALYGHETGTDPWESGSVGALLAGGGRNAGPLMRHMINNRMAVEMARRLLVNDPTAMNIGFRPIYQAPASVTGPMLAPLMGAAAKQGADLTH